jgi:hypothetical protein
MADYVSLYEYVLFRTVAKTSETSKPECPNDDADPGKRNRKEIRLVL